MMATVPAANPTYIGIAFPFSRSNTSFPAVATDNDLVKQALIQLVLTGSRERVMRPSFGSGIYSYIFENNDALLQERVTIELTNLISKFEPRVALTGVTVTRSASLGQTQENVITITLSYVVLATQTPDTATINLTSPQ